VLLKPRAPFLSNLSNGSRRAVSTDPCLMQKFGTYYMTCLRASALPSALSSPPASPEWFAMAGRRRVLKQKIFTPLNPTTNFSHNLPIEFATGRIKLSFTLGDHLTGAVYPWPGPGLKELGLYSHKPQACRAGIMLTSRRARAGLLILSHLGLPQVQCPASAAALKARAARRSISFT